MNAPIDNYEAQLLIDLTMFFKEGGVLPKAGGLFDQDPRHVKMIKAGLNALAERREADEKREDAKAKAKARSKGR
jgi:hypothetical protein